jgi:hypothetical protein
VMKRTDRIAGRKEGWTALRAALRSLYRVAEVVRLQELNSYEFSYQKTSR